MGNHIGRNINALRVHYGLSQMRFAEMLEVAQTSVSSWERGITIPRQNIVSRIIEILPGVTYDDIMSDDNGFARRVLRRNDDDPDYANVPLHGSIAAGTPIEMLPINETYKIPRDIKACVSSDCYLLKVRGNSMDRVLPNGSYALIEPCDDVAFDNKPYAVCINGNEATIKRVRKLGNGFELVPDSTDPTYRPKIYDYNNPSTEVVTVLGRVVWYCIPFPWDF